MIKEKSTSFSKIKNEDKLKMLNDMIVDVEKEKFSMMYRDEFFLLSEEEQVEKLSFVKNRMMEIEALNENINDLISYAPDLSNKLYLTDIFDKDKPEFGSNNLILAPVGSGKTTLITDRLIENKKQTVLLLVSNNGLKDSLAPIDDELRKEKENRMFTTENKKAFGNKLYKIHIMTYAEFGEKIFVNDDFVKKENIEQIFCDEIHSLPEYISYGSKTNGGLMHAQRFLFNKHEDLQIFYFTATNENLIQMEKNRKDTLAQVKIFNYLDYPNIMKYVARLSREISNIEQIRQYLKDRKVGFDYYNYKGIAFSKTISSLKKIEKIVVEEGYNPLVLWSDKNENNLMTEEQLKARVELLSTNKIPEPYNFLIYNSALQEGWDLKDNSVKLAIMNTSNQTELTQALGRLRRDVDLLIYRSGDKTVNLSIPEIPSHYLKIPLTSEMKDIMCQELNVIGNRGLPVAWRTMKKMLVESKKYNVEETYSTIDNKKIRVTIITKMN